MDQRVQLRKALSPLIILSQLCGVLPVGISQSGKVSPSKPLFFYGLLLLSGLTALDLSVRLQMPVDYFYYFIFRRMDVVHSILVMFAIASYILQFRSSSEILETIFSFNSIIPTKNLFRNLTTQIIVSDTIITFSYYLYYVLDVETGKTDRAILGHIVRWLELVSFNLINLQLVNFLFLISEMFSALHEKIILLPNSSIGFLRFREKYMSSLMVTQGKLCDLSDLVAQSFAVPCICNSIFGLSSTVLSSFALFWLSSTQTSTALPAYIVWTASFLTQLWIILYFFEKILRQV